jgi:hypothetical protein
MITKFATWLNSLIREDETDFFSRAMRLFGKPVKLVQYVALRSVTDEGAERFSIQVKTEATPTPGVLQLASVLVPVRAECWVCERLRIVGFSASTALLFTPSAVTRIIGLVLFTFTALAAAAGAWAARRTPSV